MIAVIRAALLAAAVSLAAALPAAAQQATSDPAATPPAVAQPADPTVETLASAAERKAADLDAMLQQLKHELQSLTDSAREGARNVLNRESPYVITADQLAVIAAGAVAGALVIDFLGGGGLATLAGAAVGGVAGHWLYTNPHQMPYPAALGG